ncbi:MAG: hypothetical protein IT425_08450 [Pirellulales bacterium]|nr:hypothetical protein [Pirellulales bacterium]
MALPRERFCDLLKDAEKLRARGHGVIETAGGELVNVQRRSWPTMVSLPELWPVGPRYHRQGEPDRCWLYYNQPRRMPRFLALRYIVTTAGTTYRTFRAALQTLDAIAELKGVDAIVCDAANSRLSDRLMKRLGWEALKPQRWHRNFIRRYYGAYPNQEGLPHNGNDAATRAGNSATLPLP